MADQLLTDFTSVKVTTDVRGDVWVLDGCKLPKATSLKADVFVPGNQFSANTLWRVPGLGRNASLLLALYREVQSGRYAGLEVCSPLCCPTVEQRNDPEVLLYASRAFSAPCSSGGWHRFDTADLHAYRLAERYLSGDKADPTAKQAELRSHVVYPSLTFVDGLDMSAVADLLGLIIDPRWYVDPANPDQVNKLPQFLGLDPRAQAASKPDKAGRVARNRAVLSCWKTAEPPRPGLLTSGQFLWKTWYARGGGDRGDLAASKRFIEYLRQTWLSALARDGHRGRLFVPAYFFHEDTPTAAAWVKHSGG